MHLKILMMREILQILSSCATLMRSAPSTLPLLLAIGMNALRRACTIIESGRDTDAVDCEPSRSSGSQRSCCMRFTPSWDTRGLDGNRSDCFQFKIFCRVTWRCGEGLLNYIVTVREMTFTDLLTNGGKLKDLMSAMESDTNRHIPVQTFKHNNTEAPPITRIRVAMTTNYLG